MSVLHRLPAGAKLAALVMVGAGVVALPTWWAPLAAMLLVLAGYPAAGLGREAVRQLRPLLWVVAAVAIFHAVVADGRAAVDVVASLLTVVLAAGLVTATTTSTELVEVTVGVLRPLRRFGADPERAGLMLALSIRSVSVVSALAYEIRDAQRARGLATSPRAFGVPLLVRSLRHGRRLGEALVARGVDD